MYISIANFTKTFRIKEPSATVCVKHGQSNVIAFTSDAVDPVLVVVTRLTDI
jgi:hypothetical protein